MVTAQRIALFIVVITMLFTSVAATSASDVQKRYDDLTQQVNQARGLALTVLREIQQIDKVCRDNEGNPLPGKIGLARTKLRKVEVLVASFNSTSGEAEKSASTVSRDLQKLSDAEPIVAQLNAPIKKIEADLKKYRRNVDRYYGKTVGDFGRPVSGTPPTPVLAPDQKFSLTGEVAGGLGNSRYERPNANPEVEASAVDISFGAQGEYAPSNRTTILANIDHKSTVERREIGLTNLGASVSQQFSPYFSGTAGLTLMKYSDKENDFFNYNDFGIFGKAAYQKQRKSLSLLLKHVGRSYANAGDDADYGTTNLTTNAILPVGEGRVRLQLKYFKKAVGNDFFDHNELNPSIVWFLSPSNSELGLSYQKFSHPNQDSSLIDNSRIKAHLHMVKRSGYGTSRWGPEVMMYDFPNAEEKNYVDLKLIGRSTSRKQRLSSFTWDVLYRLYSDSSQFDFAQLQLRKDSRPVRSGGFSSMNLAGRFYTESSDEDDSLRFASVAPAHTADFYWHFGWSKGGATWLKRLAIGPVLATKMYFDTERADAFDEDLVDVDFILQNPRNSARAGVKVGIVGAGANGVTFRADLAYMYSLLYNADPVRTTNILEINSQMNYPVNNQWAVEGYTKIHRTQVELESAADLNKINVGVRVKYLFDISQ